MSNSLDFPPSFQVWSPVYGNMGKLLHDSFEIAYKVELFKELKGAKLGQLSIFFPPEDSALKAFLNHPKILNMKHSGNTIGMTVGAIYKIANSSFGEWYLPIQKKNLDNKKLFLKFDKKMKKMEGEMSRKM